jgi:phage-related tail protein
MTTEDKYGYNQAGYDKAEEVRKERAERETIIAITRKEIIQKQLKALRKEYSRVCVELNKAYDNYDGSLNQGLYMDTLVADSKRLLNDIENLRNELEGIENTR